MSLLWKWKKPFDERHKLVKDVTQDLNLEVEKEDIEELLEEHDHELTTDELKELKSSSARNKCIFYLKTRT